MSDNQFGSSILAGTPHALHYITDVLGSSIEYVIISKDLEHKVLSWNKHAHYLHGCGSEGLGKAHTSIQPTPEDPKTVRTPHILEAAHRFGRWEDTAARVRKKSSSPTCC